MSLPCNVTFQCVPPFQEFGDSARARKLYEQDSDDDDEDGELEPNPKLEAGDMERILMCSRISGRSETPERAPNSFLC